MTRLVDEMIYGEPMPGDMAAAWRARKACLRHLGCRRVLGGAALGAPAGENATIVFIVCDRGDRYLSTGVFPA